MSDLPVGLSTGCFYRTSFFECLPLVREAGFSMLEIASAPAHLDPGDRDAVLRAGRLLRDQGIEAYSYHAPWGGELDITAPDPLRRRRALDAILRAVDAAARLEARHVVLHPGPELAREPPADERLHRLRLAAATIDVVARRCREEGPRLVLENMLPHLLFGNARDLLWILAALREPGVGICLDTGHAHLGADLPRMVRLFAGNLRMLHVHDNRGHGDDHLPPGLGEIDWPRLLRRLDDAGFHGGLVLELDGDAPAHPSAVLGGARQARRMLRDEMRRLDREEAERVS